MSLGRFLNLNKNTSSALTVFDQDVEERIQYVPETRITIPANNSQDGSLGSDSPKKLEKHHLTNAPESMHKQLLSDGKSLIYIGKVDFTTKIWEGYRFAVVSALPVCSLTDWKKFQNRNERIGGLALWSVDKETGQRVMGAKGPGCKSKDGLAPLEFFLGKQDEDGTFQRHQEWDNRRKAYVTIGFDMDGQALNPDTMCLECPLGQFFGKSNSAPVCKDNTEFIVYLPAQIDLDGKLMSSRLAVISGNPSVSMALKGRGAGKSMGHINPKIALTGLDEWSKARAGENRVVEILVDEENRVTNITERQLTSIVGFSETDDLVAMAEGKGYITFPPKSVQSMTDLYEILQGLVDPNGEYNLQVRYVVMSTKVYDFAPQGFPDVVGTDTPVHPLALMIVSNNAMLGEKPNPQRIPFFQAKAEDGSFLLPALTPAQYLDYHAAQVEGMKFKQLWLDGSKSNRQAVREKMAAMGVVSTPITISEVPAEASDEGQFDDRD